MNTREDEYLAGLREKIKESIERARRTVERAKADFLTQWLAIDQLVMESSDNLSEKIGLQFGGAKGGSNGNLRSSYRLR
jgi:hypothetical protein